MAARTDYFFRQKVTEAELDLAFELLERADRHLAADIGVYGIISGAAPAPHTPVPNLTIDLTAPARAYDNLGQRIFFGTGQTVDCAVDLTGVPTEVPVAGQERWLGVFLRFDRLLSDPRTDGNSQQVFFRRDESFAVVVRQGPLGPVGGAPKVPLMPDELLVCDVLRRNGQIQIQAPDIYLSRRQAFVFAQGDAVEIVSGVWSVLAPAVNTVQAALDEVDAELAGHFSGTARRHRASDIDFSPHGSVGASDVQAALAEVVDDLAATTAGSPGSKLVGADAAAGAPHALVASTVDSHLSQLLSWLNAHLTAVANAHAASAVSAAAHEYVTGATVQAQLEEIVDDLRSSAAGLGASRIGDNAIAGNPRSLAVGSVRDQLAALLVHLNTHVGSADHDGRYFTEAEADGRFYNVGESVANADTVDGQHASAFALAGHDHDDRYLRRSFFTQVQVASGAQQDVTTLVDGPDIVTVSYNYVDTNTGMPMATTYVLGALTPELRCWVTKINMGGGDKDYRITVRNDSAHDLWVNVAAYRRD